MAHILIIDDEYDIRDYLSYAFTHEGHQVAVAENGNEGLRSARQNPPDIILLDLGMPHLDGVSLLEIFKRDPALAEIPVVILTAQTERAQIVDCLEKGANDYLIKPFNLRELLARINVQLRILHLEKQLRESEAYHRALFEGTADPTLVIALDGEILQANEAAVDLLDVAVEAVAGQCIHTLVSDGDKNKFEVAFTGAFDGSEIPIFEIHLDLSGGRHLPVDVDITSADIDGERHLLLHLRDIRRRKSAEVHSSMILQHIGDAVFITTHNGIIMLASASASALTGYAQDELIGLDIAQFQAGETAIHRTDPENGAQFYEGELQRRNGETIPIEWTQAAFKVAGEIFYIGVVRDLTDRRLAETHRMETERLEALLEIAGGAAHEINQPLTAILGYAGIVQTQLANTHPAQEHLQHIVEAAERISGVLKQMQTVRTYRTRPYAQGYRIVDFGQSSQNNEGAPAE